MSKRKNNEQLTAYLDGELSEAERRRVEQSLAGEPALAKELAELRAVRDMVRHLPREEVPADFARRFLGRLERRTLLQPGLHEKRRSGRPWLWAAAALLLISAAAGVFAVITHLTGEKPPVAAGPEPKGPAPSGGMLAAREEKVHELARPAEASRPGGAAVTKGSDEIAAAPLTPVIPAAPTAPVVSPKKELPAPGPVAAGQPAGPRAAAPAAQAVYVPVNTGDLTGARRGLEMAMFDLEIPPQASEDDLASAGEADGEAETALGYRAVTAGAGQAKYVVANVRQSQLPGVLKGLEEFRRRQGAAQESLVSAQTALAKGPEAPGAAQVVSQAAVLDRGRYLRSVLAEAEGQEKALGGEAKAGKDRTDSKLALALGAERDGMGRAVTTNVGAAQQARMYVGDGKQPPRGDSPADARLAALPPASAPAGEKPRAAEPAPRGGELTAEEKLQALLRGSADEGLVWAVGDAPSSRPASASRAASASRPAESRHKVDAVAAKGDAGKRPGSGGKSAAAEEPVYDVYVILNTSSGEPAKTESASEAASHPHPAETQPAP